MKKKIIGILVCTLLILTAIPAVGIMNDGVSTHKSASSDPLPDLEVYALDRDFKTFEAWFKNIGDADITDFTMHWYVDGDEIEIDCNCQNTNEYNDALVEKLFSRSRAIINFAMSMYRDKPKIANDYQELLEIEKSGEDWPILCNILTILYHYYQNLIDKYWDEDNYFLYLIFTFMMFQVLFLYQLFCGFVPPLL